MNEETNEIPTQEASGPYHDFWLLREGEQAYTDYMKFAGRKDAPVRVSEDILAYFEETLKWVSTRNPSHRKAAAFQGLNWFGPTIIEQSGGAKFAQICAAWANLLRCSPERLILPALGALIERDGIEGEWMGYRFWTQRNAIVSDLERLAEYGRQAATGEFYILHLGL